MGYDNDECAICYLNGYGNNSVGDYDTVGLCFACLPKALGMVSGQSGNQRSGRAPSELNRINAIDHVNCYCDRIGFDHQLGLRLPCCDRCKERIYDEIDEELGPRTDPEDDSDDYDSDDDELPHDTEVDDNGGEVDTQSDNEDQSEPSVEGNE